MIADDTEESMNKVTLKQFLADPEHIVCDAAVGEYTAVRIGDGKIAVIIDDTEWTMLRQALSLCTEHPEWTINSK